MSVLKKNLHGFEKQICTKIAYLLIPFPISLLKYPGIYSFDHCTQQVFQSLSVVLLCGTKQSPFVPFCTETEKSSKEVRYFQKLQERQSISPGAKLPRAWPHTLQQHRRQQGIGGSQTPQPAGSSPGTEVFFHQLFSQRVLKGDYSFREFPSKLTSHIGTELVSYACTLVTREPFKKLLLSLSSMQAAQ